MKLKAATGGGMRGAGNYVEKDDSEFICGTQSSLNDFLRETAALRELRPDCKKPVLHFSLSQPPGEPLTSEQWREAVDKFLKKMGLENNSHYCKRHCDTNKDHIHILVNKIGFDGKLWDTQNSAKRGMKACTEIEAELGLTNTRTLDQYRQETGNKNRGISPGALRQFERTGTLPNLTKKAITRRKAAENERNRQDRAACNEPTTERTVDVATDRATEAADVATVIANQTSSTTTEYRNRDSEREHSDVYKQHPADKQRLEADKKAATQEDFQLKKESIMQNKNGAQAQEIDNEDQPPTLGGRLRAELREEAEKRIFDLYFDNRELPTFAYHIDDRKLELLATPTPQNVSAFFDACSEKNMKPLRLFGDDQFLRLAVEEAQKRGYPLDTSDPKVKAIYEQLNAAPAPGSVITPALSSTTPTPNLFAAVADRAMQSASRHLKF